MKSDKTVADAITKMVGKPYYLGDESKGLDCLNSLKNFYEDCGLKFPREFREWNENNYRQKWMDDVEDGRSAFWDFLHTLGQPIDINYALRGDLLIFRRQPTGQAITDTWIISALDKAIAGFPFMKKFIHNVIAGKQILTFPGIYTGNGHFFMIFDRGAHQLPLRLFKKYLVEVRRLI